MPGSTHRTLVCVPLMVDADDHADALDRAGRAKDAGADLVEYRIDRLFQGDGDEAGIEAAIDLCARSPLPCIVTCRPTWEGGEYDGVDTDRVSLFEALGTAPTPPAYIDIELEAYRRSANLRQKVNLAVQHPDQIRDVRTRLILSSHDFDGRPAGLDRTRAEMLAHPAAAVHKIAFRARSLRDAPECFEITRGAPVPTIALAMGDHGLMSRVLAPKHNALLTFASLDDDGGTAPGQPTIHELLNVYRFREITSRTRLFGVIGDPVSHSKSPLLHNALMRDMSVDAVYLALPIAGAPDPEDGYLSFRATLDALLTDANVGLAGASVTIPHKVNALRFAIEDEERTWTVDRLALLAGAANTIEVDAEAGVGGVANTDALAIQRLLTPHAEGTPTVSIVGAGGVARGAAAASIALGLPVRVLARREEQAAELCDASREGEPDADIQPAPCEGRLAIETPIAIQCTPIGMGTGSDPEGLALRFASATSTNVLLETVYTPVRTPAVVQAEADGATVITGDAMFLEQAIAQAVIWHGDEADTSGRRSLARAAIEA